MIWACSADPQTRWTRVTVAVVTAQTAVSPVSVTSTVSVTMTAALTMKPYVKVSCTLPIQQLFSVSCQLFLCSSSQLVPHLVKEDVGRSTTLRTSATATPSAPSIITAAATMQTFVTVRVATHSLKYGIVLYFAIFFPVLYFHKFPPWLPVTHINTTSNFWKIILGDFYYNETGKFWLLVRN